ncbi:MAG TPA: hypothetical protein ENO08_07070, partial [Candidatus Eisenbacteria bacterium]|nr:hypothetical protein [Candidatus Eisenbacteria bacterium]
MTARTARTRTRVSRRGDRGRRDPSSGSGRTGWRAQPARSRCRSSRRRSARGRPARARRRRPFRAARRRDPEGRRRSKTERNRSTRGWNRRRSSLSKGWCAGCGGSKQTPFQTIFFILLYSFTVGRAIESIPGAAPGAIDGGVELALEYTDRFNVTEAVMGRLLAAALSRSASYGDLFFEHTIENTITMEEGIVKESATSISHGLGIRAVQGESTGYAFTGDLTLEKMRASALTAAAIADSPAETPPIGMEPVGYENRYPVDDPATGAPLEKKIAWIREAEGAAWAYDPSIAKVTVTFSDRLSTIQIATSDGRLLRDVRPMLRFGVSVVSERNGNRQIGLSSGGGRIGTEYFAAGRSPADLAREAARQAVLLLDAVDAPAGPMELILAPAESGILLHESVGHPLEADFIRKGTSAYTGRVGHRVASELVTVIDDGTIPNDRGSINFDDEGTIPAPTMLIEKGVLKGFMHDRISAGLFGVPLTGNGRRESYRNPPVPRMTITYLANGAHDPEEILR